MQYYYYVIDTVVCNCIEVITIHWLMLKYKSLQGPRFESVWKFKITRMLHEKCCKMPLSQSLEKNNDGINAFIAYIHVPQSDKLIIFIYTYNICKYKMYICHIYIFWQFWNCTHWIEKHGIEVRQDDWLIMVISRQHGNVLSVQLLPMASNGSHFVAVIHCALTNDY